MRDLRRRLGIASNGLDHLDLIPGHRYHTAHGLLRNGAALKLIRQRHRA